MILAHEGDSQHERDSVEIWFKLIKDSDGYPASQDWEELWATPKGDVYIIESIPFFDKRVSRYDWVRAQHCKDEDLLKFTEVIRRGGHSTIRLLVNSDAVSIDDLMRELQDKGAHCERTLDTLVAVDIPPGFLSSIDAFLADGKTKSLWSIQDGFIFEGEHDSTLPEPRFR